MLSFYLSKIEAPFVFTRTSQKLLNGFFIRFSLIDRSSHGEGFSVKMVYEK